MRSLYLLTVTIHVLAAFVWLGGMFFLAAVGAPVLRRLESAELRSRLFRDIGEQFRRVGWACIGVLIVTGTLILQFRGILNWEILTGAHLWTTPFGRALAIKLSTVAVMIATSAHHDFVLGPRASRLEPGSPEGRHLRRRAALLARLNALLGVVVIAAAVVLTRGG